ncbi:hypothetical protein DPMN_039324 [Dreissena polymorpha]|uniref:Uncharacterized protein n=1 Tax=Dreissena polymorpha TaxID=45954 RepID=A0A9D4RPG1_DREPO|nr:hypothetical protein DPMN_039324 [Dreissena polymorpha]
MRNPKRPTAKLQDGSRLKRLKNLIVIHRAGSSHGNADALSRSPCSKCATQESRNTTSDDADDHCESEVCRVVPFVAATVIDPSTTLPDSSTARSVTRSKFTSDSIPKPTLTTDWTSSRIGAAQLNDPSL